MALRTYGSYTDEQTRDAVASALTGGTNVTVTADDANDSITIDTSALNAEEVEDQVSSLLTGGTNVSLTYDDANSTLTIDTSALNAEEVEDQVSSLLVGGSHLTATYDDANNTLTLDVSDDWVDIGGDTMTGNLDANGTIVGVDSGGTPKVAFDSTLAGIGIQASDSTFREYLSIDDSFFILTAEEQLNLNANLTDGAKVVYDVSNSHVPAARVEDGEGSGLDADSWEGYDLQKNGTDGSGVVNFKT